MQILEGDWPLTLAAWNANEKVTRSRMETMDLRDCFPEPASIVRLARDCSVPSILPAAFYHLNELYREDDSKAELDKRQYDPSLLSLADMHALIVGREAMRSFLCKWLMEVPMLYTGDSGPACATSASRDGRRCCDAIPHWWMREFIEPSLQRILWPIDHLELFNRELQQQENRICIVCRGWLGSQFSHACSFIWRALPEWFLLEESSTSQS